MSDYMKLSQDAANEIWSVILRREYKTPGARKRAIEREIRSALEKALCLPSTTEGFEDGLCAMELNPTSIPKPNPYASGAAP